MFFVLCAAFCLIALVVANLYIKKKNRLENDSKALQERSLKIAKLYDLPEGTDFLDITEKTLAHTLVEEKQKTAIRNNQRRIILFSYPSDGLKIKGLVSFVPDPENHPLLVNLRGGNRVFGVMNPGNPMMCAGQYTVLATAYRDGVSEGTDEFGGDDVNDVKNLIDFIPTLESKLGLHFLNQKSFLLGGSRGGMQMFLALGRFPELQNRFSKIVSLSGMLNMRESLASRPDVEKIFIEDFGLVKGVNEEEWINRRDPILTVSLIKRDLPILIIQGTDDIRVNLRTGYSMLEKLKAAGNNVTYWEIKGGDHCLSNREDLEDLILKWFQE